MSDLEHIAIERLKTASEMSIQYYEKPLVICISGGKDEKGEVDKPVKENDHAMDDIRYFCATVMARNRETRAIIGGMCDDKDN